MKGMEGHPSPPPPAGATRPPPPMEQRAIVDKAMKEAQSMEAGDVYYCLSAIWHDHWLKYTAASGEGGQNELHPGRIDNAALAAGEGSRELNRENVLDADFVLVPESAYSLLKEWFGSSGPDFPRRVIDVGTGAMRETRVNLYPYFVSYSSGDSIFHVGTARERRGGEALMLDTTTPASRFLKELCKAAGVEPRYARVYLVSDPSGQDAEHQAPPPSQALEAAVEVRVVPAPAEDTAPVAPVAPAAAVGSASPATEGPTPASSPLSSLGSPLSSPTAAAKPVEKETEAEVVFELRKLAGSVATDAALTLEDIFFGQTRPRVFVENLRWRFELKRGDRLDAEDDEADWYDSEVLEVIPPKPMPTLRTAGALMPHIQTEEADADMDASGGKVLGRAGTVGAAIVAEAGAAGGGEQHEEARPPAVKIHFRCWESRWDTTVQATSPRLQPLFSRAPDWRRFTEGMHLEVKCPRDGKWYWGKVLQVREAERRVLVSSDGDVAPPASSVGGRGSSPAQQRERWYAFDSEELCRRNVHIKREPPSPSPSPRGNGGERKRLSSFGPSSSPPSSALLGAGAGSTAAASAAAAVGAASGQGGYVLGSGSGAGAAGSLSLSSSGGAYGARPRREPGVVGLCNLGNTCFMNSMLQCLSNTAPLTEYFLAGKHEAEVNETNVLGTRGALARVYAELLQSMWRGEQSPVSPIALKRIISQFAPQFAGYQQHDSQELMNFLLDGLHEDLNRVRVKPYFEAKDYAGEPDEELAGELWRCHLLRNDSVVVDRCQGQYKSHMTCPKCGYESVTFDPYLNITLPIPVTSMVKVAFTFHPLPLGSTPIHAAATLPSAGTASALKAWIAANLCKPREGSAMAVDGKNGESNQQPPQPSPACAPACINLCEVVEGTRVYKDLGDAAPLTELARPNLALHAYELERPATAFFSPAPHPTTGGKGLSYRLGGRNTPSPPPSSEASRGSPAPAGANGEGEVALVTLQFAKVTTRPFLMGGKAYERVAPPVRFALPMGAATTNAAVHERAWAAVQRFLKDDGSVDGPGPMRRPYALLLGNSVGGSVDAQPVPEDAEPFSFKALQGKVLYAAFDAADYPDHVDMDLLRRVDAHPSVRRDSLGDSSGGGRRKAIDLRQCLEKFAERELLGAEDPWRCGKCKELLQAYKKMDLWSLPDVLILHLKRFSYVQGASSFYSHTREKIEDLVTFPLEGLDLSDAMRGPVDPSAPPVYDLYAVSEHVGGLGGGHYTAVARNPKSGTWYAFNDSFVQAIDPARLEETVVTPRAYVLFYKRRTGSLRWGGAKPPAVPLNGPSGGEQTGGAGAGAGNGSSSQQTEAEAAGAGPESMDL